MGHSDWPESSRAVDAAVDDLPHASSGIEWWYVNLHVTAAGAEYSAFAAFFRTATIDRAGDLVWSYSLNWAVADPARALYWQESLADRATVEVVRDVLAADTVTDPRLRRALLETMSAGVAPLPDHPLHGEVRVAMDRLDLEYGRTGRFHREGDGTYRLRLVDRAGRTGLDLALAPLKAPVRHGADGVVRGTREDGRDGMFYYCIPRCRVEGTVVVDGETAVVTDGSAWYDHEFGGQPRRRDQGLGSTEAAWEWAGVQLDNGWDLSLSTLYDVDVHTGVRTVRDAPAIASGPGGERVQLETHRLEGFDEWTSVRTFNSYPTRWRLRAPFQAVDLVLTAAFPDQECRTLSAGRGFWEGRVDAAGVMGGRPVRGRGFVEVLPAQVVTDIEQYLDRVGSETLRQVRRLYPDEVTDSTVAAFLGSDTEGVGVIPTQTVADVVVGPVRHIVDAAGKSWRGFLLLAAIELAGGDVERYRPLLGAVELLHSGSLIIDDIQDDSDLRRGVPTAHRRYGVAHAINAGTAAYFAFDRVLRDIAATPEQRARIYEAYFDALRAAHIGQALDIAGHWDIVDRAVLLGNAALVEDRVLSAHRLKTAAFTRALATIGSVLAGAPDPLETALRRFYTTLGVAYQIVDDVIDIRPPLNGKHGKRIGDDLRSGKITMPMARALSLVPFPEAVALRDRLAALPDHPEHTQACISILEASGAVDSCLSQARSMTNDAWSDLASILPESHTKAMIHAFAWFVVYRNNQRDSPWADEDTSPPPRLADLHPGVPIAP